MNKVLVTLLIYFRSYKNLKFKDFIEYSINSILRKIFNLYNFLKFTFFSSYTHKIHNVKINHLVDLNFLNKKKIGSQDEEFIENTIKNRFRNFSKEYLNFNLTENNKELWIKKNINFSNKKKSLNLLKKIFGDEKYRFMNWHSDLEKKKSWANKSFHSFYKLDIKNCGDPKFVWEISRLQQLTKLSIFYFLEKKKSNKKNILKYLKHSIFDFLISNPPMKGINWVSPMEVSIRGANLALIVDIIGKKIFSNSELLIIINYLNDHKLFILNNLEYSKLSRTNHYLSNIVGLMIIAYVLPDSKENKEILSFAVNQFLNEIENQFLSDGGNVEGSTGYHLLSNEMIIIGFEVYFKINKKLKFSESFKYINSIFNKVYLILKNSKKISRISIKDLLIKTRKINFFSKSLIKNDETFVQIGDNDSGCFISLDFFSDDLEKKNIHKILNNKKNRLCIFNKTINKLGMTNNYRSLKQNEKNYDIRNYRKKKFLLTMNSSIELSKLKILSFKNFGIYKIFNKQLNLFIVCKRKTNFFYSGHSHDDNLSIDIQNGKINIITDPGTFCYAKDTKLRQLYRSSKSHFVPRLSDQFKHRNLFFDNFYFASNDSAECLSFKKNEFIGLYSNKESKIVRKISIFENVIQIVDYFNGPNIDNYSLLEKNINVSSSFGVLNKTKSINMKYFTSL